MLNKELVNYQDKLYWVKEGSITDLRNFWMCDMVVRNRINNDDTLLFMREIEEAEIVID